MDFEAGMLIYVPQKPAIFAASGVRNPAAGALFVITASKPERQASPISAEFLVRMEGTMVLALRAASGQRSGRVSAMLAALHLLKENR